MNLQTADRSLVADKDMLANALFDVPNAEGGVARAGDGGGTVGHFEAADGRSVAAQHVYRFAVEGWWSASRKISIDIKEQPYPVAIFQTLTSRSQPPETSVSPQGTMAQTPITWPCRHLRWRPSGSKM